MTNDTRQEQIRALERELAIAKQEIARRDLTIELLVKQASVTTTRLAISETKREDAEARARQRFDKERRLEMAVNDNERLIAELRTTINYLKRIKK